MLRGGEGSAARRRGSVYRARPGRTSTRSRRCRYSKPNEIRRTLAGSVGANEDTVVVEDAAAGVQAAKAGRMAAIGIARADDEALLLAAGADIVVTSLDQIDRAALAEGRLARATS